MKTTIYRCDGCGKVLGDEGEDIEIPHLSIIIGTNSGLVTPATPEMELVGDFRWRFEQHLDSGIFQFCNTTCLGQWIKAQIGATSLRKTK